MISLSNRGFPMLRTFYDAGPDYFMSIDDAQKFDQRPFRSMLIRKYVSYRPGRGFYLTKDGRAAFVDFMNTEITRKDPSLPLTAYFDPTAYGLKIPKHKVKAPPAQKAQGRSAA